MKDIYLNKIFDDMGRKEWEKLRLYKGVEVFSGVFDGNGHTVYGVYSNGGYGLTMRNKGEIRNLSIHNSIICGGNYRLPHPFLWGLIGGICKENSGVISKCDFGGKLYASAASGGWQTIAIKREQTAYIPFLVRGDIYRLLGSGKNCLL